MTVNPADNIPTEAIESVYGGEVHVGDVLVDDVIPGRIAVVVGIPKSHYAMTVALLAWSEDGDDDCDLTWHSAAMIGRVRGARVVYTDTGIARGWHATVRDGNLRIDTHHEPGTEICDVLNVLTYNIQIAKGLML